MNAVSLGRAAFPVVGELVVATIKRIESYGAYVSLDEYDNREGLLHISEISSTWVRNIRNHVREGQKVVLQVLRVDPTRGQIDLSLRRVSKDEHRKKIEDWKKTRKGETLIKGAAGALGVSEAELYEKTVPKIVERFGSLYAGLEELAKRGAPAFEGVGVPPDITEALAKAAKEKIAVRGVTIQGVFEITSMEPRGVEAIRTALLGVKEEAEANDADASVYTLGAPRYRIEVTAEDYKKAEAVLEKIIDATTASWAEHDGKISFRRE